MAPAIYTVGIYLVTLLLEKKYSIIQLKALGKNNSHKRRALMANLIGIRLAYLPLHAVHVPTEVVVRTDQRATNKHVNLIFAG